MAASDLIFEQGKTFTKVLRWEAPPIIYKPITGIAQVAPARITCPSHGIPDGWRVAIVSVKGMTQINAPNTPPKDKDFVKVNVVDVNTIEINTVNASDYKAYTSGGYVQFNTPVSLHDLTARMTIKDKIGGTTLMSLTTENGRIALDDVAKTISINISAADTALIEWKKGVYDLEMVDPTGVVSKLVAGTISVAREVTT